MQTAHRRLAARVAKSLTADATLGVSDSSLVPIQNLELPTSVPPNERVPVQVKLSNQATIILPTEPDVCTRGGFNGFLIDVELVVDGQTTDTATQCVTPPGAANEFNLSFVAPAEPGDLNVFIKVRGADTGNLLHNRNRTVTVRSDAPTPPVPSAEPGATKPFRPFACLVNPLRACNTGEVVAMGTTGFGFLLFLALAII